MIIMIPILFILAVIIPQLAGQVVRVAHAILGQSSQKTVASSQQAFLEYLIHHVWTVTSGGINILIIPLFH